MKYENYRLPGGKTLSEGTFEDIRWQYGVFRCNSTGAGRDKKYTPWRAVKTKLGEIEECDWCKLVEAVIERENEVPLLNALIQWCNEHNYVSASVSEMRKEALQLHASRIFDNPQWIGFIPFNAKYRPEILNTANIVFVRMACCPEAGAVTQEQIDRLQRPDFLPTLWALEQLHDFGARICPWYLSFRFRAHQRGAHGAYDKEGG